MKKQKTVDDLLDMVRQIKKELRKNGYTEKEIYTIGILISEKD